jgi:signal transduction histidine kinase
VVLDGRLPREIEAATYFLVGEALTNAARHSDATVIKVCVAKVDAGLRVGVADDGRGGATRSDDGGLQGVADRLAALGARLELDSPVGGGTRISTVLPCA